MTFRCNVGGQTTGEKFFSAGKLRRLHNVIFFFCEEYDLQFYNRARSSLDRVCMIYDLRPCDILKRVWTTHHTNKIIRTTLNLYDL